MRRVLASLAVAVLCGSLLGFTVTLWWQAQQPAPAPSVMVLT